MIDLKSLGTNDITKETGYRTKPWATKTCSDLGYGANKQKIHTKVRGKPGLWDYKSQEIGIQEREFRQDTAVRCGLSIPSFGNSLSLMILARAVSGSLKIQVDEDWCGVDCTLSSLFLSWLLTCFFSPHLLLYQNFVNHFSYFNPYPSTATVILLWEWLSSLLYSVISSQK